MRKVALITIVLLLAIAAVPAAADGKGTQVTRFEDLPWFYFQCIPHDDWFEDIPTYFFQIRDEDTDVCVLYEGLESQTVTEKKNGDFAWSTSRTGTATFYLDEDGPGEPEGCGPVVAEEEPWDTCTIVLAEGKIKMDEIGRDLGGDTDCMQPNGRVIAEADPCPDDWGAGDGNNLFDTGKLDFLEHHWKVTVDDELVVYYHVAIHGFDKDEGYTKWCISSKLMSFGNNCPGEPVEEE